MKICGDGNRHHLHVPDDVEAVAQVGQRLQVGGAEQRLFERAADPLLIERLDVVAGEAAVGEQALLLHLQQPVAEEAQRQDAHRGQADDDGGDRDGELAEHDPAELDLFREGPGQRRRRREVERRQVHVRHAQRAEAAGAVGMGRKEPQVEAREPPEKPHPHAQPPRPAPHQELEHRQAHQAVPPAGRGQAHLGGAPPRGQFRRQVGAQAGVHRDHRDHDQDGFELPRRPQPLGPPHETAEARFVFRGDDALGEQFAQHAADALGEQPLGEEEERNRQQQPRVRAETVAKRHQHPPDGGAVEERQQGQRQPGNRRDGQAEPHHAGAAAQQPDRRAPRSSNP